MPDEDPGHLCRFCGARLSTVFADLGVSPLANSYIEPERRDEMEPFYPLRALVCSACLLVQLPEHAAARTIFSDYAYFSSYSSTWLEHCDRYARGMIERLQLGSHSRVVEVASNDGYLLQFFAGRGVPVLGIEPAANVAAVAEQKGLPTRVEFFGREVGARLGDAAPADLIVANNVLGHVADLDDFVSGFAPALKSHGIVTLEFPHLLRLMAERQFDTIYHEHFSYFSLTAARQVLAAHGLTAFEVEELPTHGGSLRVHARHQADRSRPVGQRVEELVRREARAGLHDLTAYEAFAASVPRAKRQVLGFLIDIKERGLSLCGYGAPAKGNTLLNYCGIGPELLDYTVDASPHKQGRLLPGSRIPIEAPGRLRQTRPDVVVILPWNLSDEIRREHAYVTGWGGRFAARKPEMGFLPEPARPIRPRVAGRHPASR